MKRFVREAITIGQEKVQAMERPKIWKLILLFFAIMIGLTLFSRITYNMILPKVYVEQVSSGEISKSITAQGQVDAETAVPVYTKEGLLVNGILVSEGQRVSEGEVLYTVDPSQVDRKISDCQSDAVALLSQIRQIKNDSRGETGMPAELYPLYAEYEKVERELLDYRRIKGEGYGISAPKNGMVTVVNTAVGQVTQGSADLLMASGKSALAATAVVSTEEGAFLGRNTIVDVSAGNGADAKDLKISSLTTDATENSITVRVKLPDKKFFVGQPVDMILKDTSRKYECCIPRSALNLEGDAYFVYGITEEETILGTETTVVKQPVTVQDKNAEYAAVEGIYEGDTIIVRSDKIIRENIKVRVME